MKVFFITLGCKVNQYETEAIEEIFINRGYERAKDEKDADIIVVNTCSVTSLAESKSRKMLRRARRENPEAIISAIGCYSQVGEETLKNMPEIDIILGTGSKSELPKLVEDFIKSGKRQFAVSEISENFEPLFISDTMERTRAVMKIQDGCSQFCSYCIIPYARGGIRSRSLEDIISEAKILEEKGFKEIVLTGIHVASYGKDFGGEIGLIDVIEALSELDGIKRIRLSSLEQSAITEDFMERVENNKKFCEHFHLSLQSGSETVLKRMNRHYTPKEYREKVDLIRSVFPDAGITTDIIVGFPMETDKEFKETCDFVREIGFSKIHIFPYSIRKGTPAASMEQVEDYIKTRRAKELSEIEEKMRHNFLEKFIGREMEVLAEREISENLWEGHSSNYLNIVFNSEKNHHNQLINVLTETCIDDKLLGKML